jgi:hypothetical protein
MRPTEDHYQTELRVPSVYRNPTARRRPTLVGGAGKPRVLNAGKVVMGVAPSLGLGRYPRAPEAHLMEPISKEGPGPSAEGKCGPTERSDPDGQLPPGWNEGPFSKEPRGRRTGSEDDR